MTNQEMSSIEKIVYLVQAQIQEIIDSDAELYKKHPIIFSTEQQYIKNKDKKDGAIYMVIRFAPSSLILEQVTQSVTFNIMGEKNGVEIAQRFLTDYANAFNMTSAYDGTVKQVYTTPETTSNFNEVFDGYRSLLYMSGTFVVSNKANPYEIYDSITHEKIECVTITPTINVATNTQTYFDSEDNFNRSYAQNGTFTFTIVTYLLDNDFCNKCLAAKFHKDKEKPNGINQTFTFDIVFKNGYVARNQKFKLVLVTFPQNLGENPSLQATFTE